MLSLPLCLHSNQQNLLTSANFGTYGSVDEGDPSRCGFKGHGPLKDLCSSTLFCSSPCTHLSGGERGEAVAVQPPLISHENINYIL